MTITIAAIILMFIWIPIFIFTTVKIKEKTYLFTKTFSSIMFLALGLLGHFAGVSPIRYSVYIIISLVFGMIGDVFLIYSNRKPCFASGLFSFLIGHLIYGILFLKDNGFSYYDFAIFFAILLLSLFVYSKSTITLGDMKLPAFFYLLAITFMYTMALSTVYKHGYPASVTAAIIVGSTLFAASDAVLAFNMFSKNPKPALFQINLGLYYFGQMIIASSIILF